MSFLPDDYESQYAEAQRRLKELEGTTPQYEEPTPPRRSFLDFAAAPLSRGIRDQGYAVLPGANHTLANIASVLAQGYLGGRALSAERMFDDYDQRRRQAVLANERKDTRRSAEVRDAREDARRAASDLAKWKTSSTVLDETLSPHAPGYKAGQRVPLSVYEMAVKAKQEKDAPVKAGAMPEGPKLNDYTGLLSAIRGDKDLQDFQVIRSAYSTINTVGKEPSAAGDIALVFGFMRINDPGSTVREGEQATAANARGVPEAIRATYNRILTGERLSPDQRADFMRQSGNLYRSRLPQYERAANQYRRLAINYGLDPDLVMRDLTLPDDRAPDPAKGKGPSWFEMNARGKEPFTNPFGGGR